MKRKDRLRLDNAAVVTVAAMFAFVFAASLVVLSMPAKKMAAEISADDGLVTGGTSGGLRPVRVIVASPYQR